MQQIQDCLGQPIKRGEVAILGDHYGADVDIILILGLTPQGIRYTELNYSSRAPGEDWYGLGNYSKNFARVATVVAPKPKLGIGERLVIFPEEKLDDYTRENLRKAKEVFEIE